MSSYSQVSSILKEKGYQGLFLEFFQTCCAVLSHSVVSDSFVTPWTVACEASLSMGIPQAGIREWVGMPSSKGSSQPRDWTQVSHCRQILYQLSHQGSPRILEWGSPSLLQEFFPTQESNQCILHCRQILYHLSCQGSPLPTLSALIN